MIPHYHPLLVIALIAVLAPLFNELPLRVRLPSVVLEIVCGIIVGPQGLGLVRPEAGAELFARVGMVFLMLSAGMEIDFSRLRGRPLRLAAGGWLVSLAVAVAATFLLHALGLPVPPLLAALALTTTAIGTLLPILRDHGELSREFGLLTLAAGAAGEFGPLLLLSLVPFAGHTTTGQALGMAAFATVAVAAGAAACRGKTPWVVELLRRHLHATSRLPVRLAVLLMAVLVVLAVELGFEILIGAFAAGMIIGLVARGEEAEPFRQQLDGLSYGFLIPIFFVVTGAKFDLHALAASTTTLLCIPLFLALFLLARGAPTLLYRRFLTGRDRLALAFYSATGLPVVVAITEVGVATGQMTREIATAFVGAGMASVLVFPQVAAALRPRAGSSATAVEKKDHAGGR